MKRRSSVNLGPGAASLILVFVMLSMSVLGILSLHESVADAGLSARSIAVAQEIAALQVQGEETLAAIRAVLAEAPEDEIGAALEALAKQEGRSFALEGDEISWQEADGHRVLDCGVRISRTEQGAALEWIRHRMDVTADLNGGETPEAQTQRQGTMEVTDAWNW